MAHHGAFISNLFTISSKLWQDSPDAGRDWARGQNQVQLMLMMLAGLGHVAKTKSS